MMFAMTATMQTTVTASNFLSLVVRTTREKAQAARIGREAIQRQNHIHPNGWILSRIGDANMNPPAVTAATPPTKHGNRTLYFDATISVPSITERAGKNGFIFSANVRVDARLSED
jgi:hypothetical protein